MALSTGTWTRTSEPSEYAIYICTACGNPDIEFTAWTHANTGDVTDDEERPCDSTWCSHCEDEVDFFEVTIEAHCQDEALQIQRGRFFVYTGTTEEAPQEGNE